MLAIYTNSVCPRKPNYTALAVPNMLSLAEGIPVGYGDAIAVIRRRRGLSQEALAARLNVEQPTVQRWERGLREPNMTKLAEIAKALRVDPGELFGAGFVPLGPRLFVKGEVAAGVWREAYEWPEDDWQSFTGRPDVKADVQHRFGLRVTGDSMNAIYPEGTIVECVSTFGHTEILPGKRVVIVRTSIKGQVEATVKELQQDEDGKLWAVPKSLNPAHSAIALDQPEEGITETRIVAVVVASYRPE